MKICVSATSGGARFGEGFFNVTFFETIYFIDYLAKQ